LKQIYCSYPRTHNIQSGFLHSLSLFLRSTLLLNKNKHIGEECFVFYKFEFQLNTFTDPCPTAPSAATCVLSNSTSKLIVVFLLFHAATNGLGGSPTLNLSPGAGKPRYATASSVVSFFAKCFHVCCCNMILQIEMLFGIYVVVFNIVQTTMKKFL